MILEIFLKALRDRARREGKSLDEVALEALSRGAGLGDEPSRYHDLNSLAGTWEEDPQFDEAIRMQDQIDLNLWK